MLKYDIQEDYVSWHLTFPIKSAENGSHFVFCLANSQNCKKEKKIIVFMKFMEKKKSNKLVAPRIWSYDQKITLYSLPLSIYMPLGKTSLQILCSTRPNPLSLYNVYISDKTPFHCTTCVCIYIYICMYMYTYIYILMKSKE